MTDYRIPRRVEIKGHTWIVKLQKLCIHPDGSEVDGWCDEKNRIMYVQRDENEVEQWLNFRHEYVHALLFELAVGQMNVSEEAHEVIAQGIAQEEHAAFDMRLRRRRLRKSPASRVRNAKS